MPKRILVLSASVGAGHIRAAEAVELALRQLAPEAEIQNINVLDLTNATFRRLYGKLYVDLVNTAPFLLGFVYDMLDRPPSAQRKSDRLRLLIERLNLGRLLRLLRNNAWDVIVNTHFLPAEIIAVTPQQRPDRHAPVHGHDRFRDAPPVGQSALRALFHGDRRRGRLFDAIGACRPKTFRSPAFPSIPSSARRRTAAHAASAWAWAAIAR